MFDEKSYAEGNEKERRRTVVGGRTLSRHPAGCEEPVRVTKRFFGQRLCSF